MQQGVNRPFRSVAPIESKPQLMGSIDRVCEKRPYRAFLRSGVAVHVDSPQPIETDVRVDLGRTDGCMSEQILNNT